jgi:hypothetical protein
MLDRLDPSRGDRIEDSPEVEELYRRVVEVQPEIVGLMKKYSDQKGELSRFPGSAVLKLEISRVGAYSCWFHQGSAAVCQDDAAAASTARISHRICGTTSG